MPKLPLTPTSALQSDYAGGRYGRAATTPAKPIAPNTPQGAANPTSALQSDYAGGRYGRIAKPAPAQLGKQSSRTPRTPLTPFQFGQKIADYSSSAGLGALGGAGLGGLAGLVAPGETSDGKKRGRISGALRGALAGGAVGGIGGLGVEGVKQSPAIMAQINALRGKMTKGKDKPADAPADMTPASTTEVSGVGKLDALPRNGGPESSLEALRVGDMKPRQDATYMPTPDGARRQPEPGPTTGAESGKALAALMGNESLSPGSNLNALMPRQDATYSPTPALLAEYARGKTPATMAGDLNLGGPRMITDADLLGQLPSTYSPTPDLLPEYARGRLPETMSGDLNLGGARMPGDVSPNMREIDTFSDQGFRPRPDATYSPSAPNARPRDIFPEDAAGGEDGLNALRNVLRGANRSS